MNTMEDMYLAFLTEKGVATRYNVSLLSVDKTIQNGDYDIVADSHELTVHARVKHELDTIGKAGFAGYFLVVADILRYCREAGIPTGPGRGSICGSAVAYAIGITDVEPMRFGIPFERFLHLERIAQPDIDLDICQARRQEVITYLRSTYGEDSVAQIITFTPLNAKGVVRDVCRVLHVDDILRGVKSNETGDKLALMIPEGSGADQVMLEDFVDENDEFRKKITDLVIPYDGDDISVLETCYTLEGLRRHGSVHAAGVVIADRPLIELAPLYKKNQEAEVQIQFDMRDAEDAGLLKMDILGLRTVTVIGEAESLVRRTIPDFNIKNVPLDDAATFKLLQDGDTVSVFQLEGDGITNACIGMQPDRFEDVIALIALYRPGPMEQLGSYFARKKGEEAVSYAHPEIAPILERTYGLMVYQEQVMGIVRALGGYTAGEADMFRKAIGKKLVPLIQEKIDEFVQRAVDRGHNVGVVKAIGEQIFFFGRYGFNLGHATGYAFITYWTAYLKANWPREFYTANLNSQVGTLDKIGTILRDAEKHGISVLPPSINESGTGFTFVPETREIRFGIGAIKGVGESAVLDIVEERDSDTKNGYESVRVVRTKESGESYKTNIKKTTRVANEPRKFESYWDFCNRLPHVTITVKKALIAAGAFDIFKTTRAQLFADADNINVLAKKGRPAGQPSGDLPSEIELLRAEKEVLGFYVSNHPLQYYKKDLQRYGAIIDGHLDDLEPYCIIGGLVLEIRLHQAKNGEMAWVKIESGITDLPDITMFNSVWADIKHLVVKDELIVVNGKKEWDARFGWNIKAQAVRVIDRARPDVDVLTVGIPEADATDIEYIASLHNGDGIPLNLLVQDPKSKRIALMSTSIRVMTSGALVANLEDGGYTVNMSKEMLFKEHRLHRKEFPYGNFGSERLAVWDVPTIARALKTLGGQTIAEMEIE